MSKKLCVLGAALVLAVSCVSDEQDTETEPPQLAEPRQLTDSEKYQCYQIASMRGYTMQNPRTPYVRDLLDDQRQRWRSVGCSDFLGMELPNGRLPPRVDSMYSDSTDAIADRICGDMQIGDTCELY